MWKKWKLTDLELKLLYVGHDGLFVGGCWMCRPRVAIVRLSVCLLCTGERLCSDCLSLRGVQSSLRSRRSSFVFTSRLVSSDIFTSSFHIFFFLCKRFVHGSPRESHAVTIATPPNYIYVIIKTEYRLFIYNKY